MAEFKTAQSQYVLVLDVNVEGTVENPTRKQAIYRNDLVTLVPAAGTTPAYIKKASSLNAATHMIAHTDQTVGSVDHIHTEVGNYASSEIVAATVASGAAGEKATIKKVGVYPLFEKGDIILDADGNDLSA
jgi:hypothetical protein